MKKSQVLAALALAFALGLGVIAPVANTYAKIVGEGTTVSSEQMKTLNADVKAALRAYNELEKVSQYSNLYTAIDGKDGLAELLDNKAKIITDNYNDGFTITTGSVNFNIDTLNENVEAVEDLEYQGTDGLYAKNPTDSKKFLYILDGHTLAQATLRDMPSLKQAADATDAYKQVKALYDAAVANQEILSKNYATPNGDNALTNVVNGTNYIVGVTQAWLTEFNTVVTRGIATPEAYAEAYLKPVNEESYKTLLRSDAWKNATDNAFTVNAVRFQLFIDAAKALPKYSFTQPLVETKESFDKISASNQAVDYDKALEYIAAFNTAINNYKNGTAPEKPVQNVTLKAEGDTITVTGNFAGTKVAGIKAVKSDKKVEAFGDRKFGMWDIELVDKDGKKVTYQGSVVVRIKVPEGINGSKSNIYYVADNGKVEKIDSRIEDGYMVFTANHFSLYAIVEDNGQVISAPETGILAGTDGNASSTVAMVAGVATALTAAGAGVVAYRNARRSTRK